MQEVTMLVFIRHVLPHACFILDAAISTVISGGGRGSHRRWSLLFVVLSFIQIVVESGVSLVSIFQQATKEWVPRNVSRLLWTCQIPWLCVNISNHWYNDENIVVCWWIQNASCWEVDVYLRTMCIFKFQSSPVFERSILTL